MRISINRTTNIDHFTITNNKWPISLCVDKKHYIFNIDIDQVTIRDVRANFIVTTLFILELQNTIKGTSKNEGVSIKENI